MQAVAHSPSFAKKVGVPQSVGKEFAGKDKAVKKRFSSGGAPQPTAADRAAAARQDQSLKGVKVSKREADVIRSANRSEGSMVKKAKGGSIDGIAKKGKTKCAQPKMAKGGRCK